MQISLFDPVRDRPHADYAAADSTSSYQSMRDGNTASAHDFGPASFSSVGKSANAAASFRYGADGLPRGNRSVSSTGQNGQAPTDSDIRAEEERVLRQLRQRDDAVRTKEEAKGAAVAGESYIYQTGPDGRQYAVGTAAHLVRREPEAGTPENQSSAPVGRDGEKLSDAEQEQLRTLKERDAHVRQHEAAHIMAGGGQVRGAAAYEYQTGPDGRRYAVGGSVQVAVTSAPADADDMERQAKAARRAAMAAGDPSAADMHVARQADSAAMKARMQKYGQAGDDSDAADYGGMFLGYV